MPSRPYLRIDLATVRRNVAALRGALPTAEIRYAVKANPAEPVLRLLADLDCTFDVASVGEIDLCAAAGVDGALMTFGNPLKKPAEVAYAFARGVRRFTFDTAAGLEAIAENAPGSSVECRIAPAFPSSVTPFGHKFGCAPDEAVGLLSQAARLGLRGDGLAFHVGSQQLDPGAWEIGIRCARDVFDAVPGMATLNLGGGIPVSYDSRVPSVRVVGDAIADALERHFPALPHIVIEPGRAIVGSAGTLYCEVVSVRTGTDGRRWVYLDIGRYGGLAETENEYIRYRLRTSR
ncbi:alanine racemase, partial [Mycolicibacterium llatzerense]